MVKAKRATKRNARRAALALGAAGVSLVMTGGASATAPTSAPSQDNARQIFLGEEEIADISLATFHVFDRENESPRRQGLRLAGGVPAVACAQARGGGLPAGVPAVACAHGGGGCAHGGGGCAHGGGGCAHGGGGCAHVPAVACAHGGGGGLPAGVPAVACAHGGGGCAHVGGGCAHGGGGCAHVGGGCAHVGGGCAPHVRGCAGHGCRGCAGHGCRGCGGCGWGGVWLGIACLGSVACTGSCWQWDRYLRRWINVCY